MAVPKLSLPSSGCHHSGSRSSLLAQRRSFLAIDKQLSGDKAVKKLCLLVVLLLSVFAAGQGPQPGDPSFSPIENHGFYSIDLQDLHINVDAAIRTKTGYGTYSIGGSSFIYKDSSTLTWQANYPLHGQGVVGLVGGQLSYLTNSHILCNGQADTLFLSFTLSDRLGTAHPFGLMFDTLGCYNTKSAGSSDGSGLTLTLTNQAVGTVYDRAGNKGTISAGTVNSMTDPNGNVITSSTDTLGVTALTLSSITNTSGTYTFTGGDGSTVTTILTDALLAQKTVFGCSGVSEESGSIYYPTKVTFASGSTQQSTLTLGYEPTPNNSGFYTGRLASITLPTSGQITFAYSGGNSGINCVDGTTNTLKRTTPDGTWTYVHTPPATGSVINTTTVTDPLGNETDYTFSGQFVVQVVRKDPSHTVLATSFTCYNGNFTNCTSATVAFPITQRDVYSQLTMQTTYTVAETTYDTYGNVTDSKLFGTGSAGSAPTHLLEDVISPVGTWTGSTCAAIGSNIQNRPCYINITDGAGNGVSSRVFSYDARGNLLSQQVAVDASQGISGPTLTSSATFNTNGTVATSHDPNNTQTTYTEGQCNALLLTNVSVGGLSASASWDSACNGGVPVSSTDANGQSSSVAHNDPFWRTTSATDPLSNTANIYYGAGGTSVESVFTFGTTTHDTTVYNDTLGRPYDSQTKEGPSVSKWDTTTTYRDVLGRAHIGTLPCLVTSLQATCSSTGPNVTTNYDALGRVTSVTDSSGGSTTYSYTAATVNGNNVMDTLVTGGGKTVNIETDALGRVTSVCEVSTQTGSGACGQAVAKTGFLTTNTYDVLGNLLSTTKGVQTRSFTYDALSRPLTVTTPEAGTVKYFYDTAPSTPGVACSVTNGLGHLVKKYDANGNTTCYSFDSLGRNTSIVYSGPNDNGYNKYFVYDSAVVDGFTMSYTAGRLAEAYTAQTQTGTKQTDEGFSYDQDGRLTTVYESTPNSGGYYVTTVNYFADGTPMTLSLLGQTSNWVLDGKGRLYSESQGTTTEVSSVTYNPADQPLVVTFGSGDKDTYTWDANTLRMKSYQFSVGATPVTDTGTLTWNTNGTLQKLAIVDNLNTPDTQTCTYGYDDLARIASVGCGTPWAQTFTYDIYGNITKNGSLTWRPGYNAANNRYILSGTSYDANGNLLNDTFHTYTWDVDGKVMSIDGTKTFVYDAFENVAEWTSGTTHRQYLYTPIGFVGTLNGQTVDQVRIPLPGGGSFVPGGNLRHNDWLGSTRLITTPSRTVVRSAAYAPFGETYAVSGTGGNLSFAGLNWDDDKGTGGNNGQLFDADARELHPSQGRWISPDPIPFGNRYAYVGNNPLIATDPTGLGDCPPMCEGGNSGAGDGAISDDLTSPDPGPPMIDAFFANTTVGDSPFTIGPLTGNLLPPDMVGPVTPCGNCTEDSAVDTGPTGVGAADLGRAGDIVSIAVNGNNCVCPVTVGGVTVHGPAQTLEVPWYVSGIALAPVAGLAFEAGGKTLGMGGKIMGSAQGTNGAAMDAALARIGQKSVAESLGIAGKTLSGEELIQAVQNAQGMVPQFHAQFVNSDLTIVVDAQDFVQEGIPLSPAMRTQLPVAERKLNIWLQHLKW
jgi:RHS repeat-associated protein